MRIFTKSLIATSICAFAPHLNAAIISAQATGVAYSYTNYESAFLLTDVSSDDPTFDTSTNYYAFCIDFTKDSYYDQNGVQNPVVDLGITETLAEIPDSTTWNVTGQDIPLATAQLGYLIDTFFVSKVENGDATTRAAFAQAVWEITEDGGNVNPLNYSTGAFSRTNSGNFATGTALRTEMDIMLNNLISANITDSYVSLTTNSIVKEDNLDNQDYVLIATSLNAIPEPSSILLVLLGGLIGFRRHR